MKAAHICYECLQRLVYQAADMASNKEYIRQKARVEGLAELNNYFSPNVVTITVASKIHAAVKRATGNQDPYRELKNKEIELARKYYKKLTPKYSDNFRGCLELAALGNVLDFFKPFNDIEAEINNRVKFHIDDSPKLESKLKNAGKVLYLADNAGEVFFDLPFVKYIEQSSKVIYAIKEEPVQNDITYADLKMTGLDGAFSNIITTGTATPGIDFSMASQRFMEEFESADMIIAKGMGYYESLSELPASERVFHLLMAKCSPVADSLGVPLNSFVALLR